MNPVSLMALLGQQGASAVPAPPEENVITVTGQREAPAPQAPMPQQQDQYANFLLGNRDAILERDDALAAGRDAANHKGMFSTKGTLRDILGVIGDAFLIQSGNDPMYRMKRQQEQVSDAMAGYTVDPLAAVERTAGVNPALAGELAQMAQNELYRRDKLQSDEIQAEAKLEADMDKESDDRFQEYYERAARIYGAITPENVDQMSRVLSVMKERGELGDDFPIPVTGDEEWLTGFQRADQTGNQQVSSDISRDRANESARANRVRESQGAQRIGIAQQNAQTARMNATRPRQGRAPSTAERAIAIGNKPESQRTPGERAFYNRYMNGTGGGSNGGGIRTATGPNGQKIYLRGGEWVDAQGRPVN